MTCMYVRMCTPCPLMIPTTVAIIKPNKSLTGWSLATYVNVVINEYKLWHNCSSYGHNIEHIMTYILSTAQKHNT